MFDHDIDLVTVLHVEVFGSLGLVESLAIEKEPNVVEVELSMRSFLRFGVGSRRPSIS